MNDFEKIMKFAEDAHKHYGSLSNKELLDLYVEHQLKSKTNTSDEWDKAEAFFVEYYLRERGLI